MLHKNCIFSEIYGYLNLYSKKLCFFSIYFIKRNKDIYLKMFIYLFSYETTMKNLILYVIIKDINEITKNELIQSLIEKKFLKLILFH